MTAADHAVMNATADKTYGGETKWAIRAIPVVTLVVTITTVCLTTSGYGL